MSNNGTTPTTEPEVLPTTKHNPRERYQKRTTTTQPTTPSDRVRRAKSRHGDDVWGRISKTLVKIITFPIRLIQWLTEPPGSAIPIGLCALYMIGVNVEGYWQAMNAINPPFINKPFIPDGADLLNLPFVAIWDGGFWLALVISVAVQAVQAKVMRDAKTAREAVLKAKAEYEAVKHFEAEPENPDQIEIAKVKRREYMSAGMKGHRARGALIVITYAIDIAIAVWNFPVLAQRGAVMAVNLVWAIASVFGAETLMCWFQDVIEEINSNRKASSN